jgi:hypothetical protein
MTSTPRILGALGILLILMFVGGWFWKQAGDEVRLSIERQNNEATEASDRARRDFGACPDGLWNYATGKCRWSAPGSRN